METANFKSASLSVCFLKLLSEIAKALEVINN